jgi:hypothetical protein
VTEQATAAPRNDRDQTGEQRTNGVDWEDPSVPVGDAPALPRWPVYLLAIAWGGWIVFLLVITVAGRATSL